MVEVTGSIPVPPTNKIKGLWFTLNLYHYSRILVCAAREKKWFRDLLEDVIIELKN